MMPMGHILFSYLYIQTIKAFQQYLPPKPAQKNSIIIQGIVIWAW